MSPPLLAEVAPAPPAPVSRSLRLSSAFTGRRVRRALCLLPLLLIGVWTAANWRVMAGGAVRLSTADPGWLGAGAVATCLCWAAAACIRQGAVLERLPPGLLFASQFAAGAANHVLPAGLGAHAVTLRFLQRRGIPLGRATASLALYSLVKPVASVVLILGLLAAFPVTVQLGGLVPDGRSAVPAAAGGALAVTAVILLLTAVRQVRRPVAGFLRTALTDARLLHTRPSRVLALWGGAAAFPLFQASVVACVGASLGLPLAWPHVVLAYFAASAAGSALPTPGGIGSLDAALVLVLSAFGAPTDLATATVIGYRLLTVWLPLLPGALVLTALVRGRVL